jgi:hypothetical protein
MLVAVALALAGLEQAVQEGQVAGGMGLQLLPPVALELQIEAVVGAGRVAFLQQVALVVQE